MNGKGSNQRPRAISRDEWEKRHEQTFGKKPERQCEWPECDCYAPQGPQECQKENVDG